MWRRPHRDATVDCCQDPASDQRSTINDTDAVPRASSERALDPSPPPQVGEACRRSVKRGTRPAICPELVPDVKSVADPKLSGPIAPRNARGYSLMSFNNGFAGRHFILGTGSRRWFARWLFDASSNESGGKPRRRADLHVDGSTVRLYSFSGGPNAGHVGAVVRRPDGLEAFASMHGRRYTDAVMLMALDLSRRSRR